MAAIEETEWGRAPNGAKVTLYTLSTGDGAVAKLMSYGATLVELRAPDRRGVHQDIVLGFDTLAPYLEEHPYFGATVGRVANRIEAARFSLDDQDFQLSANEGPHHLHGGRHGFDKVVWEGQALGANDDEAAVQFRLSSRDGDEGYPGNLDVTVRFTLRARGELQIDYAATTDKATPVNLTNHTYWNLRGAGDILDHVLWIDAERYTVTDDSLIPTGEIASVEGTPFDFRSPTPIGARIAQIARSPAGYDDNLVLRGGGGGPLLLRARLTDPTSGRALEVRSTEPGLQVYSGNFLDGSLIGKGGAVYERYGGICLETQRFPGAVHHPHFTEVVLRPGETFSSSTVYSFAMPA